MPKRKRQETVKDKGDEILSNNNGDPFLIIFPTDVCALILQNLKLVDILRCSTVSRYWRKISDTQSIWKHLLKE